ncbi:MAG: hypothetical protein IMZ61_02090 [Planctomycetes bacterium]|nr:hypothetical protein [Thermoplasmata archaeon]MBE3142699.1 hypothetical protein [Planctomycetota bacterium]
MTRHDKKGPELLIVDKAMLDGLETLASQFKKLRDHDNADFLTKVKTALTKHPAIAELIAAQSSEARKLSQQLSQWADSAEQLFPQNAINQVVAEDEK